MKQFNLEEYLKNPTRKVITRGGSTVKIPCTNYTKNQFIIAEIEGTNLSETFDKDGKWLSLAESEKDLFFAPEKHEGWVNLYRTETSSQYVTSNLYNSEEKAIEIGRTSENYIATTKIEWEE